MTKRIIFALALLLGACGGEGLETSDVPQENCCLQWQSGLEVPGCWMCANGVLRCVETACKQATVLPLCAMQPSDPTWTAEHPNCE